MAKRVAKPLVVVVGGGFAGLATTIKLAKNGNFKVLLLEASSNFGGRVKCIRFSEVGVPLGAMYFHGEVGNSLLDIALKRKLVSREQGRDGKTKRLDLCSDGKPLTVSVYERTYKNILADLCKENDASLKSVPVKDCVVPLFHERLANLHSQPTRCSASGLIDCFLYTEGILVGTRSLEDFNVLCMDEFVWLKGIKNLLFDGNPMQDVVDTLVKDLPEGVAHLNKEVSLITWNQESASHPVTIQCTSGEQYVADHVVITMSLGCLKKKSSSLFNPPLPYDKQEAITSVGFGIVNKVVLDFPKPIVDGQYDCVRLFNKGSEVSHGKSWMKAIHRFHTMASGKVVLIWFVGEDAIAVEQESEEELGEGVCKVLEAFLHKSIPRPTAVKCSNWYSNSFFCGSYSYSAVGSTKQHRSTLAAPVNGNTPLQLLFAGEATHPTLFSTANAAYDTGVREAQRLIDHYSTH